ncbi:UDP-glucuronosyl/UDP-glucosyltransferase [Parasponia andersonii]|uniref:UDP-glucuronosyl/UDP-glucosyltransferase n=1 Tax=Parasponia andersonii TaxID=3476 RepID=A0A2P5CH06_PARAD|nr:UDP-glucuronosyl/UDP-glucosyltransferase [Parasponia andersonii]
MEILLVVREVSKGTGGSKRENNSEGHKQGQLYALDTNFHEALSAIRKQMGAISYEESYLLLIGLKNETNDNVLIVPWCRQIEVICHSAIGGFLTHCGWNSVLESLRCGVPVLCFPLSIDQIVNRKLVVDDWRCGVATFVIMIR